MSKVFGIDLGTTYCCITYIDETGEPMVLKNSEDMLTTPSVVYFEDTENVMVGEPAKEEAILHPLQSVSLIKRDMGQEGRTRTINGATMRPEEISSYILTKLVKDAHETLRAMNKLGDDETINDVVITCPAYFGTAEREATSNAGKLAGLNVLAIINEPTAAAIDYGISAAGEEKIVLVYDLGGGTFDVTIMKIGNKEIRVLATGGNHVLGGADWDQEIITYVAAKFEEENGVSASDFLGNPETLQQLTINVEKAKKTLSSKPKAAIVVDYDGEHMRMELTREKFDELTASHLAQTIELTEGVIQAYENKGYNRSQISEILLVGGSTKMPQVKEAVEKAFGVTARAFGQDEAVAKGAARYAASMKEMEQYIKDDEESGGEIYPNPDPNSCGKIQDIGKGPDINIIDVTSRTYGLKVLVRDDGPEEERCMISNIIYKNTELPHDVTTRDYGPVADYPRQVEILLQVYESLTDNKELIPMDMGVFVGQATLKLPTSSRRGDKLEITFRLNAKGLMEMYAKEVKTGNDVTATFDISKSMSQDEFDEAKDRVSGICVS